MFISCPHCGFLAALILPAQAAAPNDAAQRCPRCGCALRDDVPATNDSEDSDPASSTGSDVPGIGSDSHSAGSEPARTPSAPDPETSLLGRQADATNASVAAVVAVVSDPSDLSDAPDPAIDTDTDIDTSADEDEDANTGVHPAPTATTPTAPTARPRRTPSFVRGNTPARRARLGWPWYAAIVALGVVLAMQLLLAQRHELAASARWRPWVAGLCNALPCTVPPWREPQAFTMLERSVQPHAAMPGVLAVKASFRNDARWPQPWPTLLLSLSDVEGRQVALRAFAPAEYREAGAAADDLLARGQSATVRLQVREPAPRIVAFTFDFQ